MPKLVVWGLIYTFVLGLVLGRATVAWTPGPSRSDSQSLAAVITQLDTVYRRDTVTLWRTKLQWDTVKVDVERWKTDTLRVVEYVALADSTIRVCTQAVQTCEQRVRAAQALTLDMQAQLHTAQSSHRKALWQWGLAGVGLGAVLVSLRP